MGECFFYKKNNSLSLFYYHKSIIMKRTIILVLSCVTITLYSCSDKKNTESQSPITPAQEIVNDGSLPAPAPAAPASGATPITVEPVTMTSSNGQAVPATGATAQPAASNEALNPPHGQPGHRCDIAVGVPLSAPPGTGTPAMSSSPSTAPSGNTQMPTAESKTVTEKVVFQPGPAPNSPSS